MVKYLQLICKDIILNTFTQMFFLLELHTKCWSKPEDNFFKAHSLLHMVCVMTVIRFTMGTYGGVPLCFH